MKDQKEDSKPTNWNREKLCYINLGCSFISQFESYQPSTNARKFDAVHSLRHVRIQYLFPVLVKNFFKLS